MIAPITAFIGMETSPPILTFFRTETYSSITVTGAQQERWLNIGEPQKRVAELHPIVHTALQNHCAQGRKSASKGNLPNFLTGDFVLMARKDLSAGKNYLFTGVVLKESFVL